MSGTGRIHSIETCGTVDGPGLRYVAFFQGCRLRCRYCHNPDTWELGGGKEITVEELVRDVLRYKSYIKFSKGGFTASGGEPLLQADFLRRLFKQLKEQGIHTAIDTTGNAGIAGSGGTGNSSNTSDNSNNSNSWAAFVEIEKLLCYTDLVLLDIKSLCPDKYRALSGWELEPTLELARYLNYKQIDVWIRHVIVPGLTDSEEEVDKLARYLTKFSNIQRVELLPFHKIGEYKWESMNLPYSLKDTPEPSDETMKRLKEIVERYGLVC